MCFKCFSWDKNGKILAGDTLSNTAIKKKPLLNNSIVCFISFRRKTRL